MRFSKFLHLPPGKFFKSAFPCAGHQTWNPGRLDDCVVPANFDCSQRTTQLIVLLARKADEAARKAARRWKVEANAARGEAREETLRAQQEVANAAVATGEALERAKEMAKADVKKGKEAAEKTAAAAREAFDKAKAARDAANKVLKRSGRNT